MGTLEDALIEHDFVTRRQLDRLRREFEANKSQKQIPGFKVLKKLGAGAMADVVLAEQKSLGRMVAIKILPKKYSEDREYVRRFYEEGKAAAQLNHANIVQAYDVGQAGDNHYFVMEYVEGSTVFDRIKEAKRIPEDEALNIMIQSAKALQHAHEKGLIHRDIKPKNLMLTTNGTIKVADLGLARKVDDVELAQAEKGKAYGTPFYISPEQIRGALDIGPQADIYGLGATCYHMITGRVPFNGKNPSEVMRRHLSATLTNPDDLNPALSPGFCQVVEKMLEKDRRDRYESTADLLEDLQLVQRGEAPHFARPEVDLSSLAVRIDTQAGEAAIPAAVTRRDSQGFANNPLAMASFVANIVLVIIVIILVALMA